VTVVSGPFAVTVDVTVWVGPGLTEVTVLVSVFVTVAPGPVTVFVTSFVVVLITVMVVVLVVPYLSSRSAKAFCIGRGKGRLRYEIVAMAVTVLVTSGQLEVEPEGAASPGTASLLTLSAETPLVACQLGWQQRCLEEKHTDMIREQRPARYLSCILTSYLVERGGVGSESPGSEIIILKIVMLSILRGQDW
jgi:hypothetical protein